MLAEATIIRSNPRVEFRRLGEGEGGVLLHLDTAAYHGLNELGAFIWNALAEGITFAELMERLRAVLEDAPPTLEDEIREFLDDLAARDLIKND
jgi:hypothetical protein